MSIVIKGNNNNSNLCLESPNTSILKNANNVNKESEIIIDDSLPQKFEIFFTGADETNHYIMEGNDRLGPIFKYDSKLAFQNGDIVTFTKTFDGHPLGGIIDISNKGSASFEFKEANIYEYFCKSHSSMGNKIYVITRNTDDDINFALKHYPQILNLTWFDPYAPFYNPNNPRHEPTQKELNDKLIEFFVKKSSYLKRFSLFYRIPDLIKNQPIVKTNFSFELIPSEPNVINIEITDADLPYYPGLDSKVQYNKFILLTLITDETLNNLIQYTGVTSFSPTSDFNSRIVASLGSQYGIPKENFVHQQFYSTGLWSLHSPNGELNWNYKGGDTMDRSDYINLPLDEALFKVGSKFTLKPGFRVAPPIGAAIFQGLERPEYQVNKFLYDSNMPNELNLLLYVNVDFGITKALDERISENTHQRFIDNNYVTIYGEYGGALTNISFMRVKILEDGTVVKI